MQHGYNRDVFDSGFDTKFLCNYCGNILRVPYQNECGHIFCRACITELLSDPAIPCLQCVTEGNGDEDYAFIREGQMFPNLAVKREMYSIESKCVNPGCSWRGNFKQYEAHFKECMSQPRLPCTKCDNLIALSKMDNHLINECPMRMMKCKHCGTTMAHRYLETEHEHECPKYPLPCDSCGKNKIPREMMQLHIDQECANKKVQRQVPAGDKEMSDPVLTKLRQLDRNDFQDLVALGTFASYENRVYLAGPCNIGKSSLASILIGEAIPKTWISTDGLIIHFGRNGIDLQHRKMIPLQKGSGDVLAKLLLGKPELKEKPTLQTERKSVVRGYPKSDHTTNAKTNQETSKNFPEPTIHTAHSIQDDLLEKIKKGTYIMNIAPSDLVDFGGQKSFDMTHQLFIQHRGTFILMFDGRLGLDSKLKEYPQGDVTAASILEHWINSVMTYCDKTEDKMPRILFAATHSDSFSENEQKEQALKFKEKLSRIFSSHKLQEHIMYDTVFFINATDTEDLEIDRLTDTLVDIAYQQSTWGQKMPVVWVPLDLQISEMREDGVKIITKERLLQIDKSNNEFALKESRVETFLRFQHSIGKLLYFDIPALRNFIVIQPSAMVNVLRAFITDIMFWPKEGPIRDILDSLTSNGVLKKLDLFTLWSQPDFEDILTDVRTKEYVVQVLLHLDILVEPTRYTNTKRAADLFLVPCTVKEKIPKNMQSNATDDRTICIAYHLKETVVPSALSFKLIGAAISIWPLKVENSRFCLFFQAAIMEADNRNELQIHVKGQRIFAYLINDVSKHLISPDLATTTQECLTLALERILQFYHRCFGKQSHHVISDLFDIEVGEICNGETCLIPLSDAKTKVQWRCENGKIHDAKCPLNWFYEKNKKHCDSNCKGLETETLLLRPDDRHFVQLASSIGIGDYYNFFIALGMEKADYDNLNFCYFSNPMDFMLMGLFEWRDKTESNQSTATFEKLLKALAAIEKQHNLCQVHREDHTLIDNANSRLQDIPSDDVINTLISKNMIGDSVVHLGVELGHNIGDIRETFHNFPRNLKGQFQHLLMQWKTCHDNNMAKPTIYRLMVALKRVGKASAGLDFMMKTYGVEQIVKKQRSNLNLTDSITDTIQYKPDFSDILDQMMTQLVISVEDRRCIEQTGDRQDVKEQTLLDIVKRRGEPNISVCIGVIQQHSCYEDHINTLKSHLLNNTPMLATIKIPEVQEVPDYKIRLQKNYLNIINTLNHKD